MYGSVKGQLHMKAMYQFLQGAVCLEIPPTAVFVQFFLLCYHCVIGLAEAQVDYCTEHDRPRVTANRVSDSGQSLHATHQNNLSPKHCFTDL